MKILYAIQGTGNGHLSRARDIIPILQEDHEYHPRFGIVHIDFTTQKRIIKHSGHWFSNLIRSNTPESSLLA